MPCPFPALLPALPHLSLRAKPRDSLLGILTHPLPPFHLHGCSREIFISRNLQGQDTEGGQKVKIPQRLRFFSCIGSKYVRRIKINITAPPRPQKHTAANS